MTGPSPEIPDSTAVRVALWRALHVQCDPPPHIFTDEIGLQLASPAEGWRDRPDMHLQNTKRPRASIVARARLIEDLVAEQSALGVKQYVILGAGLDTFAQRKPDLASRLKTFEIDHPQTQAWKRGRLAELGFGIPEWLKFVPVDFEAGASWREKLPEAGFDAGRPAVIAAAGVSMYLTREAVRDMLRKASSLARGSMFIMTFMPPAELLAPDERAMRAATEKFAQAMGTPLISFFAPQEIMALAKEAGFKEAGYVSADDLARRYFAGRADGLRPSNSEEILVAYI